MAAEGAEVAKGKITKGWHDWLTQRDQVRLEVERLETFLSKPVVLKYTLPLESLLELDIQCYLDCIVNRHNS
jgi:hypothetical protein